MTDLGRLLPDFILSAVGTLVLILGSLSSDAKMRDFLRWLVVLACGAAATALVTSHSQTGPFTGGWLAATPLGVAFGLIFLTLIAWTSLATDLPEESAGEWFGLLLFAGVGMLTLARAANLIAVFLGVEILSLALYVLVAFFYDQARSLRAAIQYLILAGFASAFLVFGLALVYTAVGSVDVATVQSAIVAKKSSLLLAYFGFAMFLVGVGFKLSAVPFHMWAAEVYEGAPAPVAGLIATASKGATFAALIPLAFLGSTHASLLVLLAGASMLVGNILALREARLKRLLAYSSIAHVGYLLTGFLGAHATGGPAAGLGGASAVAFYVAAYALGSAGAFAVISHLETANGVLTLRDLRGVAKRNPVMAFCLLVFAVSMAGLPPTVGFSGKIFLFSAAFNAGHSGLVVLGLLGSAIGLFYYLRILVYLFMKPSDTSDVRVNTSVLASNTLLVTAIATIVFGVVPTWMLRLLGI